MPIKVLHVITGLGVGGAEKMLFKLLKTVDKNQFEMRVVSLRNGGSTADDIRALGIKVDSLAMKGLVSSLLGVSKLRRTIQEWKPDLVQAWMYHANLACSAALRHNDTPLVWGIRYSILDLTTLKFFTRFLIRFGRFFSWGPARILYNANSIAKQHEAIGYAPQKRVVIPNGVDLEDFASVAPGALRVHLGLTKDVPIIGMSARFDPQKDFETFLEAACELKKSHPQVHFVLIGPGVHARQLPLLEGIHKRGLEKIVHLLGEQKDPRPLVRDFDIFTLSSKNGEAFPNVVLEALALGVPVVATNVGDTADIVGQAGVIVDSKNPKALAKAWASVLSKPIDERMKWGAAGQTRVRERYTIQKIAAAYTELYRDILK